MLKNMSDLYFDILENTNAFCGDAAGLWYVYTNIYIPRNLADAQLDSCLVIFRYEEDDYQIATYDGITLFDCKGLGEVKAKLDDMLATKSVLNE